MCSMWFLDASWSWFSLILQDSVFAASCRVSILQVHTLVGAGSSGGNAKLQLREGISDNYWVCRFFIGYIIIGIQRSRIKGQL